MNNELSRDQIKTAYRECFTVFAPGKVVLADLERHTRAGKIDRDNVNATNCVYRVAQQDLLMYMQRMAEENQINLVEIKNGRRNLSTSD